MMTAKKATVLIIGANGFIGSHLVDALVDRGYNVRALDAFTESPKFKNSEKVDMVKGRSFDSQTLADALAGVDYVFLAFSATTPFTSDDDPYTDIQKNLLHNIEIMEASQKAGVKKIAFISSGGAVYGRTSEQRKATEIDAAKPVSPYGINKLATEYYLEYFKRKFGLQYIIYRLTNPYGPRQANNKHQGVIPVFLDKINNNEKLIVYGDGQASRDYIYICDAVEMMMDSFDKSNKHGVYNIASGEQATIASIIKTIEAATGTKASVEYVEAPKTFLEKAMVSNARFINEFGVKPSISLKDGIQKMIDHEGCDDDK